MSKIEGVDAYPLKWPAGWPRTEPGKIRDARYSFRRPSGIWTFAAARNALLEEVWKLTSTPPVLSSHFKLDRLGVAVEGGKRPQDQAVAVYFSRGGKPKAIACDRYSRFEENCRSIALALEAMRALERHGGGLMLDRAFEGFTALPAPDQNGAPASEPTCWEILGIRPRSTLQEIDAAYRAKAKECHPDVAGGSTEAMARLNGARHRAVDSLTGY